MHREVQLFIERFEREALAGGSYRRRIGKYEQLFLEQVWGPAMDYRFEGLKAEYPFQDFKGGERFADFVYVKNGMRLLIEVDGYTTHARDISPGEFDDHLMRQNDMILSGWIVLRFSARQVERKALICQRQLKQAIGHWWSVAQAGMSHNAGDLWQLRKRQAVQQAAKQGGTLKPVELAASFGVSNHTAAEWMKRLVREGVFQCDSGSKRVTRYRLVNFVD